PEPCGGVRQFTFERRPNNETPGGRSPEMDCSPEGTAPGGEGTHAAERRAGAAPAGAAVGSDRQAVPVRDRRRKRFAGGPLPGALATARLSLHVWARLQSRLSFLFVHCG